VGPGACVGGQVCGSDGLAWGPCDCGPPPADSRAPATMGRPRRRARPRRPRRRQVLSRRRR
jgi:hypothetical protein